MKSTALAAFLALLVLTLLWEGWLAPNQHWPFWLTVKTLPLLVLLPGLLKNRLRTFVITTLVLLPYLTEGLVLGWTERTTGFGWTHHLPYAWLETVLVLTFSLCASLHVRAARRQQVPL